MLSKYIIWNYQGTDENILKPVSLPLSSMEYLDIWILAGIDLKLSPDCESSSENWD